MRKRAVLLFALTAAAFAAAASPAHASRSQFSIFDASEEFSGSLCCPGLSSSALDDADALGADTVRLIVHWRDVVVDPLATGKPPGDSGDPAWPGYGQPSAADSLAGWGRYDDVVRGAVARGMSVLLVPTGTYPDGRVPPWAGIGANGTDPIPAEYGLFLKALAIRYRGGYNPGGGLAAIPGASYVGVWNEPNSPFQLAPQQKDGAPYTPELYRRLYVAGRQGLLDGGYKGQIWIAELAPRGTNTTLGALAFTKEMLCLQTKKGKKRKGKKRKVRLKALCEPLQADAFAHHPHTGVDPPYRPPFSPNDIDIANLPDLIKLIKQAAKAGAINQMPLVLDEYGVQSNPPDPLFGRSLQEQAEYIGIAEYIAWRNPSIGAWSQYLDRDDLNQGGFQSGLRLRDGTPKPAFDAFRTPLVIRKVKGKCRRRSKSGRCTKHAPSKRVNVWGEVRPVGSAHVQVERNDGGDWIAATAQFTTVDGGYFERKLPYRPGRQFRLVWFAAQDGQAACPGNCVGPAIRAYSFK